MDLNKYRNNTSYPKPKEFVRYDGNYTSNNRSEENNFRGNAQVQKENYREKKKKAGKKFYNIFNDPSCTLMEDWLKIRGTLKKWTKLWCDLKPGALLIYKNPKNDKWVGTVLLNPCACIERPSKKNGFCFKLYHPFKQSIWAVKGPKGEWLGAITQPLPKCYLIIRTATEYEGRCWMDALKIAMKQGMQSEYSTVKEGKNHDLNSSDNLGAGPSGLQQNYDYLSETSLISVSEIEQKHFSYLGLCSDTSDIESNDDHKEADNDDLWECDSYIPEKQDEPSSDGPGISGSDTPERRNDSHVKTQPGNLIMGSTYVSEVPEEPEEIGKTSQLIQMLLKQIHPGMDLSKIVIPTILLEPRSFLEVLSDFYCHADFLSKAAVEEDAYCHFKKVVKWYLSGFYTGAEGLKKPYNPVLGETFRCMWVHPETNSKNFYIAEQVSQHPAVSAFYVSNRKDGFCVGGSIMVSSTFCGNSLYVMLEGDIELTFLNREEDYVMTMPHVQCRGIFYGTFAVSLGGMGTIKCEKTGYNAEIDFGEKVRIILGMTKIFDSYNQVSGKLKMRNEVLSTVEGHWDSVVIIRDGKTDIAEILWNPLLEAKHCRLSRYIVRPEELGEFESQRFWQQVTEAVLSEDHITAANEKFNLVEAQRQAAKERVTKSDKWVCNLFQQDMTTGKWHYKYTDFRPWDPLLDLMQFEKDGIIQTRFKSQTPLICIHKTENKSGHLKNMKNGCTSQTPDHQDILGSERYKSNPIQLQKKGIYLKEIQNALDCIRKSQDGINRTLKDIHNFPLRNHPHIERNSLQKRYYFIIIVILLQIFFVVCYIYGKKQ
ncbi:oxysterol-binding protein-related protein 8-like [Protopterus annectens]|uniref:oxysterol-binding protein-related protein 8-like n=1 Tax=Protopterus annectens TaxID=7888 RepID=UPI001CF96A78|nr:oxysterol-binding protein-related protein 8-like [Protopterus annectens]